MRATTCSASQHRAAAAAAIVRRRLDAITRCLAVHTCSASTAVMSTAATPAPLYLPPAPRHFPLHTSLAPLAPGARLLVVGDIHGCADELRALVAAADLRPSDMLLAAGDLVAKGPKSKECVDFIRDHGYLAILGNHEQYLLRCALLAGRLDGVSYESNDAIHSWSASEVASCDPASELYSRTFYARMNGYSSVARKEAAHYAIAESLSNEQLHWLASLPLSIDLTPAGFPWRVVHAGLAPGTPLHLQHPFHVTTMRNLAPASEGAPLTPTDKMKAGVAWSTYLDSADELAAATAVAVATPPASAASSSADCAFTASSSSSSSSTTATPATAGCPPLPPQSPGLIFGHDATRGFQHPSTLRLGLDTGCCNGKYLTGLLLPEGRLISVPAQRVYSKPTGALDVARPPPPPGTLLQELLCVEPANARATAAAVVPEQQPPPPKRPCNIL